MKTDKNTLTPRLKKKTVTIERLHAIVNYALAILTFLGLGAIIALRQQRALDFSQIWSRLPIVQNAFITTVTVSFIALVGSVILGLVFYFFSISRVRYLRAFTDVFTEIIFGTPLLVMIFMMGYVFRASFNIASSETLGLVGLTVYITPYMTNVFRAAFSSIPDSQFQAMDLFGFTTYQRYRYLIIPQVIRALTAPLMNNFSLIIKGSALLHIVGTEEVYNELFAISSTGRTIEAFFVMWLLYLIITLPLSRLIKFAEKRWST